MNLDRVTTGRDVPNDINVIIEIPMNAEPIKYEVDKETGAMFVDRFMSTAMHYPCNYGYIPHTLQGPRARQVGEGGGLGGAAGGQAGDPRRRGALRKGEEEAQILRAIYRF